jgi:hypothetical protein
MNLIVANPGAIRAHARTTLLPVLNPVALTNRLRRRLLIRKKGMALKANLTASRRMDKPRAMMKVTSKSAGKNLVRSIPGNPTPNPDLVSAP